MKLKQIIETAEAELAWWLAQGFADWCAGNVLGMRLAQMKARTCVGIIEHARAILKG